MLDLINTTEKQEFIRKTPNPSTRELSIYLAEKYHHNEPRVIESAKNGSAEQFLRLFTTAHGMVPTGRWQTHTYAQFFEPKSGKKHFYLIPIPRAKQSPKKGLRPKIEMIHETLFIDGFETPIQAQSIPHTTPFWYFHYYPNKEDHPFYSMTLNLSPSCLEKCTLCAGAKTGRVNNGMGETLSSDYMLNKVFKQHPKAVSQLDSVAVVTGCFPDFESMTQHLRDVRSSVEKYVSPKTYRVLEHNVTKEEEFDIVVKELGYDVFITLECFDQKNRDLALNGKVGRKGRDSREFLEIIKNYAEYLEARPELGKKFVRVTYLMGIDSLDVTEYLFKYMSELNKKFKNVTILPWMSIFTPYNSAMRLIQQQGFNLDAILASQNLAKKYFDIKLLENESGGTSDGYARGLF